MVSTLVLLALAATTIALPLEPRVPLPLEPRVTCTKLHMFVARGSNEDQGEGRILAVTDAIEATISGSDSEAIIYPATLIPYDSSEKAGTAAMTAAVTSYVQACPTSKIALLGYSQGAQIIGDTLGGGTFAATAPIATSLTKNLIAVIQFADPAHVAGKSYNVGTGVRRGIFARANTTALDQYSSVIQSYCSSNDVVCDSGLSTTVHLAEVSQNADAAVAYVVAKAKAAGL